MDKTKCSWGHKLQFIENQTGAWSSPAVIADATLDAVDRGNRIPGQPTAAAVMLRTSAGHKTSVRSRDVAGGSCWDMVGVLVYRGQKSIIGSQEGQERACCIERCEEFC